MKRASFPRGRQRTARPANLLIAISPEVAMRPM